MKSRVNETRKRSLLKAVSFRVLEVVLDTLILSCFVEVSIAVGLSIALEALCLALHYIFERIWNRVSYGREIDDHK